MEFKFVYFGWLVLLSLLLMPPSIYGQLRETEDENDGIVIDQPKANAVHVNERFSTNKKIFVPTDEWQEVEDGQGIPPGLHVRMNIATGKTEAKILDPNERTSQSTEQSAMVAVDKNDDEDDDSEVTVEDEDPMMIEDDEDEKSRLQRMTKAMEEAMAELKQGKKPATGTYQYLKEPAKEGIITDKKIFNRDEIREALKNFKVEKDEPKRDPEEIRKKFRPMEELKKDLEEMQLSIKTDLEILKQLLERYRNPGLQVDERVSILTDVEYHVHQIDNAQNFADMGGLDLVIKDLNNTEQEVRSEASFVIGSATQSNPRVKISAYESGALQQLVRMLPTETAVSVKNRVLYALSNLLRNFPLAQKVFLDQGGLEALHSLFGQQEAGGSTRLRVKVVTLLTDMITEKQHALDSGNEEKIRQYNDVSLRLSERGWCDDVTSLLGLPDHDTREKVLNAMAVLNQDCEFSSSTISETLHKLKEEYTKLADTEKQEDDGDDYFEGLLTSINDVLKTVSRQKDEL